MKAAVSSRSFRPACCSPCCPRLWRRDLTSGQYVVFLIRGQYSTGGEALHCMNRSIGIGRKQVGLMKSTSDPLDEAIRMPPRVTP
jgi:hypothetical protein